MLDKFFTTRTIYAVAGIALLWMLLTWLANSGSVDDEVSGPANRLQQQQDAEMVSSIQPIANAATLAPQSSANIGAQKVVEVGEAANLLDVRSNEQLHQRFKQALLAQQTGESEQAIRQYQSLIEEYPRVPENYINLANLLGAKGELDAAGKTLKQGIEANQRASALVQGLQSVHSALAAKAYRKALDVNAQESADETFALPVVLELKTGLDLQDQVQRLQTSLSAQTESSAGSKELVSDYRQQIQSLTTQLNAEKQNADTAAAAKGEQITSLTQRLTQSNENLAAAQASEREALARVVRAEQDAKAQIEQANREVAALKAELEQQQNELIAVRDNQSEQQAVSAVSVDEPTADTVSTITPTRPEISDEQRQQAIERVKSWAQAWSDQNVDGYIGHYTQGYAPSSVGSREEWVEQRRVRLTNKKFIKVEVSTFTVSDLGPRYSVTFRQHYKSDVIDDVIFKSLTFDKNEDDTWLNGKIVGERVVNPR